MPLGDVGFLEADFWPASLKVCFRGINFRTAIIRPTDGITSGSLLGAFTHDQCTEVRDGEESKPH